MPKSKLALVFMLILCLSFAGCPASVTVPNVVGQTQQAASSTLVAAKLVVGTVTTQASDTVTAGCVISQNPAAGASASSGAAVNLVISTGPAPSVAWSYQPSSATIWGQSIDQTIDGGYIVAGGDTGYNMYALKLTSAGTKTWEHTYSNLTPDSNHTELWRYVAQGIRQTANGSYIMLGAGHNYQDGYPGKSYLFATLNSSGTVQSTTVYSPQNPYSPGNFCSETQPAALELTSDGGYVAFGDSYCGQYNLASVYKANSSGFQYCRVINDNAKAYDEEILDGQQTSDDGYILAGYSENGAPHGYMALLIKLDSSGNWAWSQTYQYPAANYCAEAYAVTQTADDGYLMAGNLWNTISKAINRGPWISKVNSVGDVEWSRSYQSTPTAGNVRAIKETPEGDILTVGNMSGYLTLSKYNADGDLLWNFKMDNLPACNGRDLLLTDDGGCVILGSGYTGGATVVVKVAHVFLPNL